MENEGKQNRETYRHMELQRDRKKKTYRDEEKKR